MRRSSDVNAIVQKHEARRLADYWGPEAREAAAAAKEALAAGKARQSQLYRGVHPLAVEQKTMHGQPSAHSVFRGLGFQHQQGGGYKPELDPYQHYTHSGPGGGASFNSVHEALKGAGFTQTAPMTKMFSGEHAASYVRNVAPYTDEHLSVYSVTGGATVNRITHGKGTASDAAMRKLINRADAQTIVNRTVGKE